MPKLYINIVTEKYKISSIFKNLVRSSVENKYKNIIFLIKNSIFCDYECAIVTSSEYNIAFNLLDEIKNKKMIISIKNNISKNILKNNAIYLKSFLMKDITKSFLEYFNKNKFDIDKCIEDNYN